MEIKAFENAYQGKKILITGNTGFKGSWLTLWLLKLGAEIYGYSDEVPTSPALYDVTDLNKNIEQFWGDISDYEKLNSIVNKLKPDFIFHLAAQAIVSKSYTFPVQTLQTNIIGTSVVLEIARKANTKISVIVITSDKCYENVEWLWGYKETDRLGGKDIYSASKGSAELIFYSYLHSFFKDNKCKSRIASGRAGNVIGGGDWAKDRIVVDCFQNWKANKPVEIRSPQATRPWQHVLEPLSGYLWLGVELDRNESLMGESFNFGPLQESPKSVINLLNDLSKYWKFQDSQIPYIITDNIPFHEAGLLKLNCEKAQSKLSWEATLSYKECIEFVGEWYKAYYSSQKDMNTVTMNQISSYETIALKKGRVWSKLKN